MIKRALISLSGQEIAAELTKVIQERFGDGKKFDVSGYLTAATGGGTSDAQLYGARRAKTLDITRDLGEANQSELQVNVGTDIDPRSKGRGRCVNQ